MDTLPLLNTFPCSESEVSWCFGLDQACSKVIDHWPVVKASVAGPDDKNGTQSVGQRETETFVFSGNMNPALQHFIK